MEFLKRLIMLLHVLLLLLLSERSRYRLYADPAHIPTLSLPLLLLVFPTQIPFTILSKYDSNRKQPAKRHSLTTSSHTYCVIIIMATQMRGLTQVSEVQATYITTDTYYDLSTSLICERVGSGSSRKNVSTVKWLTSVRSSRMGISMGIKRRSILPR